MKQIVDDRSSTPNSFAAQHFTTQAEIVTQKSVPTLPQRKDLNATLDN